MTQDMLGLLPPSVFDLTSTGDNAKFWSLFAGQMDELDTVFGDLQYARDIQKRAGVVLDLIGEMSWCKRDGRSDAAYKIYLTIAIQKMFCSCSVDDISTVFRAILGEYFLGLRELYPGSIDNAGDFYLDGSVYLNGFYYLGEIKQKPMFFDLVILPTTPANFKSLSEIIADELRGAGAACVINVMEEING